MKKLILIAICLSVAACTTPLFSGRTYSTKPVTKEFTTNANAAYYAVRWALNTSGYPVAEQDLAQGQLITRYVPTTSDSHRMMLFGHPDSGVNGAYYRLRVNITPKNGAVDITITSELKSMMANLTSSDIEEKKVFKKVADYLRSPSIEVTNLGVIGE